ncbi:MAG: MoaD/ThiS family protein [Coriobacteriia bacterium]|nr:MoaD/ThiS family protein [Coriobacteriia bacterium]MBN2841194.1 MoaD/ThiS family protein [Coriobacteriia bacterium]
MDAQIPATVTVRMIATLHMYRRDRGLPVRATLEVPESGVPAAQLARELDLPLERIEGLFLNGRLVGLGAPVRPGDRVAFVPHGTPASHPAFFGRSGIERYALV